MLGCGADARPSSAGSRRSLRAARRGRTCRRCRDSAFTSCAAAATAGFRRHLRATRLDTAAGRRKIGKTGAGDCRGGRLPRRGGVCHVSRAAARALARRWTSAWSDRSRTCDALSRPAAIRMPRLPHHTKIGLATVGALIIFGFYSNFNTISFCPTQPVIVAKTEKSIITR